MENALAIITVVPFILAALMTLPAFQKIFKQTGLTWLTAGTMGVLFFWLLTFMPTLEEQAVVQYVIEWVPDLGLTLSWYLDGLSLMFGLVVTGIGFAVYLYAGYYFEDIEDQTRFYTYLLLFTGAMLTLVLAGNVITLFIAWEGTSIMSFMLIGFKGDKYEAARVGAARALIITGSGGLALLVGLVLAGTAAGSFELADILASEALREHPWYAAITILIMLGAFTKSAQFPFHFWLPGAMSAPSPASAYLHSATMVKAGIYLLFRLYPALGETQLWQTGLVSVGIFTMTLGAFLAIRQRDLKGLLAYTTISKLGTMVALIGLPESEGLKAAAVGILAHALYKGTLFLLAGTIEHSTGTRNIDRLGGLWRRMPFVAVIAGTVGLSMGGYPPLLGFVAKETLLEATEHGAGLLALALVFISSVLMVAAAGLFVIDVFFGKQREYDHFHAPPLGLNLGPALMAAMSVILAVGIEMLLNPLATLILGEDPHLHLFPTSLSTAAQLSVVILVIGPPVFLVRRYWLRIDWPRVPTGAEIYAVLIQGVEWSGDQVLKLQQGKLRYYLTVILGVASVFMFIGGFGNAHMIRLEIDDVTDALRLLLLGLTIGSILAAIVLKRHLLAALAMGISGYTIGGLFLLEPAPDVALVQFLIETLASVLIILMLARISPEKREAAMAVLWRGCRETDHLGLWRDAAIATLVGVSVGIFALAAVNDREARVEAQITQGDAITHPISVWHLENAYPRVGVPDVVSAILADFRGMDTLLEITVFSMASLGVLTLLTLPEGRELLLGQKLPTVMREVATSRNKTAQSVGMGASVEAAISGSPLPTVFSTATQTVTDEIDGQISTNKRPDARSITTEIQQVDTLSEYGEYGDTYNVPRLSTPLTRVIVAIVLPIGFTISASHILYGGDGPGDGFTAGVIGGLSVAAWYVVFGYFEARKRLNWVKPGRIVYLGLSIAILNALAGLVFSEHPAFLAEYNINDGKGPAGMHLVSSTIFEFAIFLAVFGGITAIMQAIAYPVDTSVDTSDEESNASDEAAPDNVASADAH